MRTMRIALLLLAAFVTGGHVEAQQDKSEGPYTISGPVKPPVVLYQPLPAYTEEARQAGIEGIVFIQAVVRKDGTVDRFKVLRGLGYGLDQSAIDIIAAKWRFKPGTLNGEPVDVLANIEVSFRLYRNPAERESLKEYPLLIQILEAKWDRNADGGMTGAGYGNLGPADNLRGFAYDCSCSQPFGQNRGYHAKWIDPESRVEIALGFDESMGKQKACELRVTIKDFAYAAEGQPGTAGRKN